MRDAAKTYRVPPEPDFDEHVGRDLARRQLARVATDIVALPTRSASADCCTRRAFGIAATLMLGIGLGRASMMHRPPRRARRGAELRSPSPVRR